jgi:hypothetical protein
MQMRFWSDSSSCWRLCLLCAAVVAGAAMAQADPAATLRAKHTSMAQELRQNQFKRPLVLASDETASRLSGDIYASVAYPYSVVAASLNNPDHWCDVMLLHINTKYCHAVATATGTRLQVNFGKKTPEALSQTERLEFDYSVAALTAQYFAILLQAPDGPLGTSDYLIRLEATALPDATTFLHLTYSYSVNIVGRLALQTYLGTIGGAKVGFTVTGRQTDGQADYIGGVRGLMERNTMRYYLAIDTFLQTAHTAPQGQLETRLQSWFSATERYPLQLHEMDRAQYIEMKRAEHLRQQTLR